jgi:hypothetical protein
MWIFNNIYDASKEVIKHHKLQKVQNYACIVDLNKEEANI